MIRPSARRPARRSARRPARQLARWLARLRARRVARWTTLLGALVLAVLPVACDDALLGPEPSRSAVGVFDLVWEEFDRYYSHFTIKDVDWDAVRAELRPELGPATGEATLHGVVCDMLRRLEDGHVDLWAPEPLGHCGYSAAENLPPDFDPGVAQGYLESGPGRVGGGRLTFGRLADGIGYVHVHDFTGQGWVDAIDDVLAGFGPLDGLVIDVRDNFGGSSRNGDALAGRFADSTRIFAHIRYRNGPAHDDFTEPRALEVRPAGDERFTGPVAVVTNRRCFSSCEGFTLAMDVLPHVTLVGDTTGGGVGNPLFRELPNGWAYRIPVWLETGPNDERIEGIGIAPDVHAVTTVDDLLAGRDPMLEAAVAAVASP